jgi:hypothetical protein
MTFLCRCLGQIVLFWYEERNDLPRLHDVSWAILMANFMIADLCSLSVGRYHTGTIRDVPYLPPAAKFFFSCFQFIASVSFLVNSDRMCTLQWVGAMIIQLTPFGGTLRRKNLLDGMFGLHLYGMGAFLFIVINIFKHRPEANKKEQLIGVCFACVAILWRFSPLPDAFRLIQGKYLIWLTVGLAIRQLRPHFNEITNARVMITLGMSLSCVATLGYCKVKHGYYSKQALHN